jgi:hypothetical protein
LATSGFLSLRDPKISSPSTHHLPFSLLPTLLHPLIASGFPSLDTVSTSEVSWPRHIVVVLEVSRSDDDGDDEIDVAGPKPYENYLDSFHSFYANKFVDHRAFEIAF